MRLGLVDRAYYEAQARKKFPSDRSALRHYLSLRPEHALSFNPLIEPGWIARKTGTVTGSLGPLFTTSGRVSLSGLMVTGSGVSALARFLEAAPDTAVLPAVDPEARVDWGRARSRLRETARVFAEQDFQSQRRNATSWDDVAELRFLDTLGHADQASTSPIVSVVMPTFNRAEVMGAAIRSVIDQTARSWELIVVDDGSNDGTAEEMARWIAEDSRIHLIRQANGGVSAARNTGIRAARGTYGAFLDTANTWTPECLRAARARLDGSAAQMTHAAVRIELDGGGVEYLGRPTTREQLLQGRNVVDLNALVVRRELLESIGGFDITLRRWVDYDLVLRLLTRTDAMFVPMLGVNYDHRSTSGDRITTTQSDDWRTVVLDKNLIDWDAAAAGVAARAPHRVSILLRSHRQWPHTLETVRRLLSSHAEADIEVIVIDNASPREESAILTAAFLGDSRVSVKRVALDLGVAVSANLAFSLSTGSVIAVIEPGGAAQPDLLDRVREAVATSPIVTGVAADRLGVLAAARAGDFLRSRGLDPMNESLTERAER
ncbi:MAG: glycosyltransferase [Cryobacterium sp.]|nr:glycosyltransferase [Cryobacterium sp.]